MVVMGNKFQLDEFQKKAIEYADANHSVIVSAPTGAGKTLIAEDVIEKCIQRDEKVVYTAPIKALSNQKFRDFSAQYPDKIGITTGDVKINPRAPIMIMTTEIFRNSIISEPQRFKNTAWVIFDEVHYLDDKERGTVWEETIILLPKHIRILALSATIPNIEQFSNWLQTIHGFDVKKIIKKKRPVPLKLNFQCDNTFFSSIKQLKQAEILPARINYNNPHRKTRYNRLSSLVKHLDKKSLFPAIYFAFSRRRCEELGQELYKFKLVDKRERQQLVTNFNYLIKKFAVAADPQINILKPLVSRGIAYHHAGMIPPLKEIIERLFTKRLIKLIFTTETFALGINMPAKTVIFDTLYKYYARRTHFLKTRDFYQMAGRAGRRNIDKQGYVYLKINPNKIGEQELKRIIFGKYEPINSQFKSSYGTILNLYKIMQEKLYEIYPYSFHFQQANRIGKKEALNLLRRKVKLLHYLYYIKKSKLTAKGELASRIYSFELQLGEIYESGLLEKIDTLSLFILICALVYEPRKGERKPKLSKKAKKLNKKIRPLSKKIYKAEKKFRIFPVSKKFFFNLSDAARAWYEGCSFYKLNKFTYADDGEIVRYFRIALQVMREMKTSKILSQNLREKINKCSLRIKRDIIDAEKELTEEIEA
jgi:superfamily II RNA helicase